MSRLLVLLLIVVASLSVGIGRFLVPGHDLSWAGSYEAVAHIWVGVLIALGCVRSSGVRLEAWIALGILTALEVFMAVRR